MRVLALAIGLIFCFFPYTQILEIESYNQPYALLFCALGALMSFNQLAREFPRHDMRLLFLLTAIGAVVFLITCMPDPSPVELKSLLSYLSPPIFCMAGFAIVRAAPGLASRIASVSAVTWISVGLVQTFVSPTFATQFVGQWEDAAAVVVESGRGVLGLAPEPTHFGFHMLVVATALVVLRSRQFALPGLCILAAVLLARSSSAVLAIMLGSLLYIAAYTKRARVLLLAAAPAYFAVGALLQSGVLPDSVRLFQLLKLVYEDPMLLLIADGSANARLGGVIAGAQEIWRNLFIPHGMSNEHWVKNIGLILGRNPWLFDLSDAGVSSGILVIVYQTGAFGLLVLIGIVARMFVKHRSLAESWFVCVLFFVFMSQYYISTPGFGLIYGFILARHARRPKVLACPEPAQPRRTLIQPALAPAQ